MVACCWFLLRIWCVKPVGWITLLRDSHHSGPGEAFITNLGTIIGTLYTPFPEPNRVPTTAATHVSIVAITSTAARILFGTLTDLLAPSSNNHHYSSASNSLASIPPRSSGFQVSRVTFLLSSALVLSLGQVLLASGLVQEHAERFWAVSSLIGIGYGALFSLTPLIISVIWGVENFGTNWGIVVMVPAAGATLWGVVYSHGYEAAARARSFVLDDEDVLCYGQQCYASTFWAMSVSVWIGCLLWIWAWKGPGGWSQRGIAV